VQFFATTVPAGFVGWWLVMWGVFTFYMWLGSLALNRALQFVFLALWITFFLLGAADWTGIAPLKLAGGYMGLVTAALAFYLAAAEVINETHGRAMLPIGTPATRAAVGLPPGLRHPA
jgi:succinate-acetate transporter protein